MKTILLENNGLLSPDGKKWIESIDPNYQMVDSATREYMRSDDLHFFGLLITPSINRIAVTSGFIMPMSSSACRSFGKKFEFEKKKWMQLEYFTWLVYSVIEHRIAHKLQPLTLEINYKGEDFLQDVNDEDLGSDVKYYLFKMFHLQEGYIKLNIYKNYKLIRTVYKIEDLNFTF